MWNLALFRGFWLFNICNFEYYGEKLMWSPKWLKNLKFVSSCEMDSVNITTKV